MRSVVSSSRLRLVGRVAAASVLTGLIAGCSSDVTRFDRSLYSSVAGASPTASANAYPDDVDPISTASIRADVPRPVEDVAPSLFDDGRENPAEPQAAWSAPAAPAAPVETYRPPVEPRATAIQRQSLPAPALAPAPARVDPVNTASIADAPPAPRVEAPKPEPRAKPVLAAQPAPVAPPPVEPRPKPVIAEPAPVSGPAVAGPAKMTGDEKGWTATGGTAITLREGETLYNLSKRYGVPVKALMSANGIEDAGSVKAGSRVVIPTYVYSRSAPVSAPDNDPFTVKASSARGEMPPAAAAIEGPVDGQVAALGKEEEPKPDPRFKPKPRAIDNDADRDAPDYTVKTGSVSGTAGRTVTVKQGDSLNRIASANGVSVKALKETNKLTSDVVRIGQVLVIPGPAAPKAAGPEARPADPAAAKVDPVKTAAVPAAKPEPVAPKAEPSIEDAAVDANAPARTGIDEFRWPVRGRVISSFGDKTSYGKNDGIDISVPEGTAVKAVENGVVVYAGDELAGFGNLILIRHADGWVSAYGHNKAIDVKRGEEVRRGQTIARSGRTGNADMPKLHFELRKGSQPVDPLKHLGG